MDKPPDISEMQQNILEIKSILSKTYFEFSDSAYTFLKVAICFIAGYAFLVASTLLYPVILVDNNVEKAFYIPNIQYYVEIACPLIAICLFCFYRKKQMNISNVGAKNLLNIWSATLILFFICDQLINFRNIVITRIAINDTDMHMEFLSHASVILFVTLIIIVISLIITAIITDNKVFFRLALVLGIITGMLCLLLPYNFSDVSLTMLQVLYTALQYHASYLIMGLTFLSVFVILKKSTIKN